MSPGRPRSPERLAHENTRLKADLEAANDAFERETAMRMRDEAERTIVKTEELWRVSAENEKLKAELVAVQAERKREAAHVKVLCKALRAMEATQTAHDDELAKARALTAEARAEAAELSHALAVLNRHAVGLCNTCGNIFSHHRKLESAAFRSKTPRFGKAFEHAARNGKAADNALLQAQPGKALPGPGAHRSPRDNKGNLIATGLTGTAEPYSPAASVVPIQ